jgi:hypothetical protein
VTPHDDRLALAETFLREAVYRARERQSAVAALHAGATSNCGLGERAVAVLDLSPRAREILEELGSGDLDADGARAWQEVMSAWVERQDAFDRKRNHFLKDFRARHGFDRTRYAPGVLAEFEAGLDRIGAEEDAARREAARRLLAPARPV